MIEIVQTPHPVLRNKAEPVPLETITSERIQTVLKNMSIALASQDDGVAIAAPQIGESLRIFVVSGLVYQKDENDPIPPDQVFINPVITKLSKEKADLEEGCLSVRYKYGLVKRSKKATVDAYNENGEQVHVGASGLLAQIFQHEVDHLDGVLFIDKARDVKDLPPEDKK